MSFITVEKAIQTLRSGNVVAVPTETVYGLAGLVSSDIALHKIFQVKERPFFDPLIVHVLGKAQASPLIQMWPKEYDVLAKAFWPGPLTLIAPKNPERVSSLITSGLETVALRSPLHPVARQILKETGPFAAPSANHFGKTSPTTAAHVLEEFDGRVPVVDGGSCEVGLESTVVQLDNFQQPRHLHILRPGWVKASDLRKALNGLEVHQEQSAASPGHLKHHYQPEVPLVLLKTKRWNQETEKELRSRFRNPEVQFVKLELPILVPQAARMLYSELRRLAKNSNHVIVCEWINFSDSDGSEMIFDRLKRASTEIL